MTLTNEDYREDYNGNGSTTNFSVGFYFFADSHLNVILKDAADVSTILILNTDYTVTGAGNPVGGTVVMVVAPATGETLTILRSVPVTQLLDYIENDKFPAQSHENGLDKLTMIVQEQQEALSRGLTVAPAYPAVDLELIPVADEFLQWNEDATEIATGTVRKLYYNETLMLTAVAEGVEVGLASFEIQDLGGVKAIGINNGASVDLCYAGSTVFKTDVKGLRPLLPSFEIQDSTGIAAINIEPSGIVKLRYNDTIRLETMLSGIGVSGGGSDAIYLIPAGGYATLKSGAQGSLVSLDGTQLGSSVVHFLVGDPDGAIELYHDGVKRFETYPSGIGVSVGGDDAYIIVSAGYATFKSGKYGGFLELDATTSIGGVNTLLHGDPDGGVELFYDGTKTVETIANGLRVLDAIEVNDAVYLPDQATDGSWRMIPSGINLLFQRRESSAWVTKTTVPGA